MFSKKRSNGDNRAAAYADKVSIIAQGMHIVGDVESEGDIRIDGVVSGSVFCKSKVVVIATGKVNGDIQAVNVDVHGTVVGNIVAGELLCLKSNCNIQGNLATEKLQIEPNAIFNGHCTMNFGEKSGSTVDEAGLVLQEN
jgi:cytoskeletal protein CcmA (bactofilin family)